MLILRCLHSSGGILQLKLERSCRVVLACAVLHNICIQLNVPVPEDEMVEGPIDEDNDENDDEEQVHVEENPAQNRGITVRNQIVANFE